MLELFLGQVPEAIYFALFLIFAKKLKNKRLIFTLMITTEYVILFKIFPFNIWPHTFFFMMTYLILKILYDERSQITDIFTLGIASILLLIESIIVGAIFWLWLNNFLLSVIIQKIVLFAILFLIKDKLNVLQNIYKNWWNRNDSIKKPIKSTTFRAVNVIVFNVMFVIINMCLIISAMMGGVR